MKYFFGHKGSADTWSYSKERLNASLSVMLYRIAPRLSEDIEGGCEGEKQLLLSECEDAEIRYR